MPTVAGSISGHLITTVRALYQLGAQQAQGGAAWRDGLNAHTLHALAAYVTAVASVEAFVNEELIDGGGRALDGSALWKLRSGFVERLELQDKLILAFRLLFNATLDPGAQPLQDFALLLKLRNDVVHYRKSEAPPKYMVQFIDREIALNSPFVKQRPEFAKDLFVASAMECTEGIRWAHNACCRVVRAVVDAIPIEDEEYRRRGLSDVAELWVYQQIKQQVNDGAQKFVEISEADARALFQTFGLDPRDA